VPVGLNRVGSRLYTLPLVSDIRSWPTRAAVQAARFGPRTELPDTLRRVEGKRIVIHRIEPQEWALLRDMRLRALHDAPEAFGQTYENAAAEPELEWRSAARAASSGDRRAWFFARPDEAAPDAATPTDLGMVQVRRRPPDDCLVFSMWVAPEARHLGVGRALIDAAADWARSWGGRRIVLWVTGVNEGAQRFYDRVGFHLLSAGPDADSGRAFGALAMELPLD
jgi:GNAT superfamily N-acetyltransferase